MSDSRGYDAYDRSSYIGQDVLRRVLEAAGRSVRLVMGITDIDDKILQKADEFNQPWLEVARRYEERFLEDMAMLGVRTSTLRGWSDCGCDGTVLSVRTNKRVRLVCRSRRCFRRPASPA